MYVKPFMFVIYFKFQDNWFHINRVKAKKMLSKSNETDYSNLFHQMFPPTAVLHRHLVVGTEKPPK